jgi:hypothetical protein
MNMSSGEVLPCAYRLGKRHVERGEGKGWILRNKTLPPRLCFRLSALPHLTARRLR